VILFVSLLGTETPHSACTPTVRRASASRARSIAASRKNTMEAAHASLVRDSKERLVARWRGQRSMFASECMPSVHYGTRDREGGFWLVGGGAMHAGGAGGLQVCSVVHLFGLE
jgi:hypothetical protein